jgi:hypothetical protein
LDRIDGAADRAGIDDRVVVLLENVDADPRRAPGLDCARIGDGDGAAVAPDAVVVARDQRVGGVGDVVGDVDAVELDAVASAIAEAFDRAVIADGAPGERDTV